MSSKPSASNNDSDRSDDGTQGDGTNAQNVKRSTRACDRCRKSKSKCEPGATERERCKGCLAAGVECTFSGPSFRRGPPKGYIQALEYRLHQMESVLAAIMSSKDPRAVGVIADLRKDDLARRIMDGVDSGPFGVTGRKQRSVDTTQDNFFVSIVSAAPPKILSERSRRQSRVTRESVTQNDPSVLVRPTLEWQDRLSEALTRWGKESLSKSAGPAPVVQRPDNADRDVNLSSSRRKRQKKLADNPTTHASDSTWTEMHVTHNSDQDELDDCAVGFGNLSIDENREVRYHDNSSGLYILARDDRWDKRNAGGVWNLRMAKFWNDTTSAHNQDRTMLENSIPLPSLDVQAHLIERYFIYVNPVFPVIDREVFMEEYQSFLGSVQDDIHTSCSKSGTDQVDNGLQSTRPERAQKMTKLLLFAMFAFATHYSDMRPQHNSEWDIGGQYAAQARKLLDAMYRESRTSTCQALLLLGVREFGLGSVEEGWLHIGMALRMAFDLGLNRNSDLWQQHGRDLFTPTERRVRRRIWWACCMADKYSAQFLGRPMAIHEADFATLLPDVSENDDGELWVPAHVQINPARQPVPPKPARYNTYFRAAALLSVIHGEVVEKIYPVTRVSRTSRRVLLEEIHTRLTQWHLNLSPYLQYVSGGDHPCPPPHVIWMHCQYWSIILLLHRPFIPRRLDKAASSATGTDSIPWRSYDICRSAASHVAAFADLFHNNYDLRWAPILFSTCLQSAGIMHIITLKHRPDDPQALNGYQSCIAALDRMKIVWHTATRVGDLLRGARLQFNTQPSSRAGPSRKRPAGMLSDDESAEQPSLEEPRRPMEMEFPRPTIPHITSYVRRVSPIVNPQPHLPPLPHPHTYPYGRDLSGAHLQDLLGTDLPGIATSAIPTPGYDWWPLLPESENITAPTILNPYRPYLAIPSQPFTFDQHQLSASFMEDIRDPVLHFPSTHPSR